MSSDHEPVNKQHRLADFNYQIHEILRYVKSLNDWDAAIRALKSFQDEADELYERAIHRDSTDSWSIGLLSDILARLCDKIGHEYGLMVAAHDICSGLPEKFPQYFGARFNTEDENSLFKELAKGDTQDRRLVWNGSRVSLIAFLAAMEHVGFLKMPEPLWFLLEINFDQPSIILERYFFIPSEVSLPRTDPLGMPYRIEWLRSKNDIARWSFEIESNNGGPISASRGNYIPATVTETFSVGGTHYSNTNLKDARKELNYRKTERKDSAQSRIEIDKKKNHPVVAFTRWTVENLDVMTKALESFVQAEEVFDIDPSLTGLTRFNAIENVRERFCDWVDETALNQIPTAYKKLRNSKTDA